METMTIHIDSETIALALPKMKVFFERSDDYVYRIFQTIEQYFTKATDTEYVKEYCYDPVVYLDDLPLNLRDALLFRIDPYFDFYNDSKMGAISMLHKYAEVSLADIPYDDNFSTLVTAYGIVGEEIMKNDISIQSDDVCMSFRLEPFTQKILIKLMKPVFFKKDCETQHYSFSRKESINIQISIISKIARKCNKRIFVLYDGPFGQEGVTDFQKLSLEKNISVLVASQTPHYPTDLSSYAFTTDQGILDLADWQVVEERIGMNLPWHWEDDDLKNLFRDYISGEWNEKTLYLRKNFF